MAGRSTSPQSLSSTQESLSSKDEELPSEEQDNLKMKYYNMIEAELQKVPLMDPCALKNYKKSALKIRFNFLLKYAIKMIGNETLAK
ncbi:hypothetical protein TSAR_006845 [Trichomalopsis sarcophagae]|uniref:Uncharacterized protein n=1 Tax=Trichomalopsis sarcophagae TaxID=543379 RepID=A0A232EYP1_9HYME|nr:hypothetical protein TSAR_006845 [Trichomalopsis sarcophagae]